MIVATATVTAKPGLKSYFTPNKYAYQFVKKIKHWDSIVIRVKANNDAHIALAEKPDQNSRKYEIVLGGWGNKQSVMRYGNQGANKAVHKGAVVSKTDFKTFYISWDKATVIVQDGSKRQIMQVKTNGTKIKWLGISTGWGSTGTWDLPLSRPAEFFMDRIQADMMSLYTKYQRTSTALAACQAKLSPPPPPPSSSKCWFKDWVKVAGKKLVEKNIKVGQDWEVTAEIKINGIVRGWSNIFRFTTGNQNAKRYGDRLSALWVWPNKSALHYVAGDKASTNRNINTGDLARGKEMKIRLVVKGKQASIWQDGKQLKVMNAWTGARTSHKNVELWVGDKFYPAANVWIQNLCMTKL